jgi:co-chaperonin GroES (HSP10)
MKDNMNIRPLSNKVAVKRMAAEKATASGIILKRTEEPDRALVTAIGPDITEVETGDVVLLNWNKATKFDDDMFIISIDEIVLVY